MTPFAIATAKDFVEAATLSRDKRFRLPVLKGGGMDLVDHLKEGLVAPDLVIDVRRARAAGAAGPVSAEGDGLRIEAATTLTEIAESEEVRRRAPVLAQAVEFAATPQVRNVATAAGNLLQRPRCWYYRADQFPCLKKGGATCFAVDGENRYHAIFGPGPCHIVHPSNLAPALVVCNAVVHLVGGNRASIPIVELFHMPDSGIRSEHTLKPGEVITHITLARAPRSGFYAVKEKLSFDWPLAFATAALELDGDTIRAARICAGAVAPTPWPLPTVAEALVGVGVDDVARVREACARSIEGAEPMSQNAYKLKLLPVVVHRAILQAAGRPLPA